MTSTIKLSYDHQIFASQVYGGISRYFYEIAKRVSIYTDFDVKMVAPFYVNEYLFRDKDLSIYGQHIKKLPYSTLATRKFNYPFAKKYLSAHTPDIVHETYFSSKSAAPKRSRLAITVFDMIHEKYSRYFPILDRTVKHKQAAILRADHIFCISNSTKNDLIELTGVDQNKVTVTHLGHSFPNTQDNAIKQQSDAPYLLYVGNRKTYKNFDNLCKAFSLSTILSRNFNLVCFGGGKFTGKEKRLFKEIGLKENNIFHVSGGDEILSNLYSKATAFVYPSFYEGFGIPILEAMAFGCPVICSNASSLPEVGGDAAVYFDPHNVDDIKLTIENVIQSPAVCSDLMKLGFEQIEKFSWDKCATQTAEIYKVLLG